MKKIARVAASSTLKVTLFTAALTAGVVGILGSPTNLKKSLNDSGIYDSLVENALSAAQENQLQGGATEEVVLNQEPIRQAAKAALPPGTLQTSTEEIIDGVYSWLEGETPTPDFQVDLSGAKQSFIAAAAQAAESHVAGLPACTPQEAQAITSDDPFALSCRPANVSPATARQKVEIELASNENFLKDPVLTADSLPKNDQGQTFFQQAEAVPEQYQRLKIMPLLLLGLSLLLGAVVFFLSDSRRSGVKSLAISLAGTGAFLLITTLLAGFGFDRLTSPQGPLAESLVDGGLQASVLAAVRALTDLFNNKVLQYSIGYILVGTAALLAVKFLWKNQPVTATAAKSKK